MALIFFKSVSHSCEDNLHRCSVRIAEGCSEARYSDSGMRPALPVWCDHTQEETGAKADCHLS